MPVLILLFLEGLYPVVGNTHGHAVVKSYATVFLRNGKTGHAAHFLGYGYGLGIDGMDKLVGKGEVCNRIGVLTAVVIIVVGTESLSEAVVIIKHRGHAVEAEAVKMVFFKPVFAVGKEEVNHLVLAVVEAERIPCRVLAAPVAIEIEVVRSIESAQAFQFVFHGVGMNNIHNHGNTHGMRCIDKRFKFLGSAEAA